MWIAPGVTPTGSFSAELFEAGDGRFVSFGPAGRLPRRTVSMDRPMPLVAGLAGCELADDRASLVRMGYDGALLRLEDGTFEARPAHDWQVEAPRPDADRR